MGPPLQETNTASDSTDFTSKCLSFVSLCCVYDTQWISDISKPLSTTTVVLGYHRKKTVFRLLLRNRKQACQVTELKKDARVQLSNLRHKFVDKGIHFEILLTLNTMLPPRYYGISQSLDLLLRLIDLNSHKNLI